MEIIYNSNDPNVLVIDTRESVRKVVLLISHNLHLSIERILITLAVVAIDASKSAFALLLACGKTNYAAFGKKINKQMNQTVSNGSTERAADNVVRKTRPLSLHVLAALANRRVSSIVKRVVRVAFVTSAIVTLVSGPSHSEGVQPVALTLNNIERCIDGTASAEEAQQFGLNLAGRFYDLRFDSGILSANCADQISASTFGYYDANTSMKLVSFLWNATALRRLLNISSTNPDQLTCDITCLLVMDRRPLPDFSLFHDLMRSGSRPSTATTEFLLARALFTKVKTSPGQIADLVASAGDAVSKDDIVKNLFLLASAEFARSTFRRQGNQICVQDRCVDVPDIDAGTDCSHMTERFSSPRSVDEAIGLKAWMLGAGRSAVYDCINMAFREPLEKIQNSFVRSVFDLSVFDPVLTFVDVVSAFRSGLLKNSDFLDENILQLTNLDLSNLQSVSWNFAEAILDQLESEASRERLAQIPMLPNLKSLLEHGTSAARLTVLLCRQEHVSSSERGAICDRRQIYLSAMNEITR